MITRPAFARLLVGLEPVIERPPVPEPVTHGAFTFQKVGSLWMPDPWAWALTQPTMQDVARNPVLPPWREWPNEIAEVPYPAQHRRPLNEWWADPFAPAGTIWYFQTPPMFFEPSVTAMLLAHDRLFERLAPIRVSGDQESAVTADTVEALVDLARKDQRDDFMWLAASAGVAKDQRDELWRGTRARLGTP